MCLCTHKPPCSMYVLQGMYMYVHKVALSLIRAFEGRKRFSHIEEWILFCRTHTDFSVTE